MIIKRCTSDRRDFRVVETNARAVYRDARKPTSPRCRAQIAVSNGVARVQPYLVQDDVIILLTPRFA